MQPPLLLPVPVQCCLPPAVVVVTRVPRADATAATAAAAVAAIRIVMISASVRTATTRGEIIPQIGAQLRVLVARAVPSTRVVLRVELCGCE